MKNAWLILLLHIPCAQLMILSCHKFCQQWKGRLPSKKRNEIVRTLWLQKRQTKVFIKNLELSWRMPYTCPVEKFRMSNYSLWQIMTLCSTCLSCDSYLFPSPAIFILHPPGLMQRFPLWVLQTQMKIPPQLSCTLASFIHRLTC